MGIMDAFASRSKLDGQMGKDPLVLILTNCSPAEADSLASTLVKERLAACVNVVAGVKSFYVWEGQYTEDAESTLLIKTIEHRIDALVVRLRELHSYTAPEIVLVKPGGVDPRYLAWARESTAEVNR